jgi:hypothetical protein
MNLEVYIDARVKSYLTKKDERAMPQHEAEAALQESSVAREARRGR